MKKRNFISKKGFKSVCALVLSVVLTVPATTGMLAYGVGDEKIESECFDANNIPAADYNTDGMPVPGSLARLTSADLDEQFEPKTTAYAWCSNAIDNGDGTVSFTLNAKGNIVGLFEYGVAYDSMTVYVAGVDWDDDFNKKVNSNSDITTYNDFKNLEYVTIGGYVKEGEDKWYETWDGPIATITFRLAEGIEAKNVSPVKIVYDAAFFKKEVFDKNISDETLYSFDTTSVIPDSVKAPAPVFYDLGTEIAKSSVADETPAPEETEIPMPGVPMPEETGTPAPGTVVVTKPEIIRMPDGSNGIVAYSGEENGLNWKLDTAGFLCIAGEGTIERGSHQWDAYADDIVGMYFGGKVKINDIGVFENFKNLKGLYLSGKDITDISDISKLENLQSLDLSYTNISDFAPLAELKNLENLYLRGCHLNNLSPLLSLENLKNLDVYSADIEDRQSFIELAKRQPYINITFSGWNKLFTDEELLENFAITELPALLKGFTEKVYTYDFLSRGWLSGDFSLVSKDETVVSVKGPFSYYSGRPYYSYYDINAVGVGKTSLTLTCGGVSRDISISVDGVDTTQINKVDVTPDFEAVSASKTTNQIVLRYKDTLWNWDDDNKKAEKLKKVVSSDKKYIAKYVYSSTVSEHPELLTLDENNTLWNWSSVSQKEEKIAENVKDFDYYFENEFKTYETISVLGYDNIIKDEIRRGGEVTGKESYKLPENVKAENISKICSDSYYVKFLDSSTGTLYCMDKNDKVWTSINNIVSAVFEPGSPSFWVLTDDNKIIPDANGNNLYWKHMRYYGGENANISVDEISDNSNISVDEISYKSNYKIVVLKDSEESNENFVSVSHIKGWGYRFKTDDGIYYETVMDLNLDTVLDKADYYDFAGEDYRHYTLNKDNTLYYDYIPVMTQVVSIKEKGDSRGIYMVREDGSIWSHEGAHTPKMVMSLDDIKQTQEALMGDLNMDEVVNLKDANLVLRAALSIDKLTEEQFALADVDNSGTVNLSDANMVLKAALGIIKL